MTPFGEMDSGPIIEVKTIEKLSSGLGLLEA